MTKFRRAFALTLPLIAAASLAGCASPVPLTPAESANDPHCAAVTVRLPDELAGFAKRATNAQATGAWGDPAAVLTRCGLPVSEPTVNPCINLNGVDWVIDESEAPLFRFEAYGREPGFEVFVDSDQTSGTDVLLELQSAVERLPQVRQCSNVADARTIEQGDS
ncbi:DUF3515 family protein [Canibacter zhoujuaniae]|uniref:DUF3515 family protein n=1 Tax=Canibacter zhoujuaniae TaxID=2708343 RepID=UPI001FBA66D7|nr:DUF3515 family protein [Canibacter zhoujuaniae]